MGATLPTLGGLFGTSLSNGLHPLQVQCLSEIAAVAGCIHSFGKFESGTVLYVPEQMPFLHPSAHVSTSATKDTYFFELSANGCCQFPLLCPRPKA